MFQGSFLCLFLFLSFFIILGSNFLDEEIANLSETGGCRLGVERVSNPYPHMYIDSGQTLSRVEDHVIID